MDADALDLRSIVDLLRRRGVIILVVTVLALGLAGLAILAMTPVYSATALVLVDPDKQNLLDAAAPAGGSGYDSLRVDSEVELVKSEMTLLAVADQLDLASDPEFGLRLGLHERLLAFLRLAQPRLPDSREARVALLGNLRDSVVVQRRGLTFLIAVTARSERPEMAAAIANAVARTYIAQQLEAKVASTLASADVVRRSIAEASSALTESEHALDAFLDQNIVRIGEATGRTDFQPMRDEILGLERIQAQFGTTAERINRSLARRDWATVAAALGTEAVANLERQRLELVGDIADAADGDRAIDLRASLAALETQLQQAAARTLAGLNREIANGQGRMSDLRAQLRTAILQSDLPAEVLTGIYQLQQSAEIARTQYQALLTRQNELSTQAYLEVADSRLVTEATPPDLPAFPKPGLLLLLAGLVGLGLGIAVTFLAEHFVGGFTSAAQAQAVLRSPVVSALPRQRAAKPEDRTAGPADALVLTPLAAFSEEVRRIRIGIDQAIRRRPAGDAATAPGAVIMVTSAVSGEGKTTVALSLARAYALAGMSTLLVDCDLRAPGIHRLLDIEPSEGLLDYLAQNADASALRSILTVDRISGASVIVGARRSDVPTDQLLAGKTFARLIEAARANFDVVLLDTPPIGPVVDGLYLAGLTDAIAFVVKFSSTPQQEVRAAMASLLNAKADGVPVLTVLNQQTSHLAAYRGKQAGYYAEA